MNRKQGSKDGATEVEQRRRGEESGDHWLGGGGDWDGHRDPASLAGVIGGHPNVIGGHLTGIRNVLLEFGDGPWSEGTFGARDGSVGRGLNRWRVWYETKQPAFERVAIDGGGIWMYRWIVDRRTVGGLGITLPQCYIKFSSLLSRAMAGGNEARLCLTFTLRISPRSSYFQPGRAVKTGGWLEAY